MSQTIAPVRTYLTVYVLLLGLVLLTVGVAYLNLGEGNLPVALTIAATKGVLIILFFMHVKDGPKITWAFAAAAFIWLAILLSLTMMDYLSRNWLDIPGK